MMTVNQQLSQLNSELMCRAVRYASLGSWEKAVSSKQLAPQTAIAPYHQLGLPDWAYKKHTFAIDREELKKWTENEQFPNILDILITYIKLKSSRNPLKERKIVELSFDIRESDEPFVLDFACRADSIYEGSFKKCRNFLQGYYFGATTEWKNYINSRVPYSKYKRDYDLPEVVIPNSLSSERIRAEGIFD
jgi:hypothetical protein